MFVHFLVPLGDLEWQRVHFTGVERSRRILSPIFPFILGLSRVGKMFSLLVKLMPGIQTMWLG